MNESCTYPQRRQLFLPQIREPTKETAISPNKGDNYFYLLRTELFTPNKGDSYFSHPTKETAIFPNKGDNYSPNKGDNYSTQ